MQFKTLAFHYFNYYQDLFYKDERKNNTKNNRKIAYS